MGYLLYLSIGFGKSGLANNLLILIDSSMKNTYLYILFQQHRKVFCCLIIGLVVQGYFIYKGVETTPFFNYGMYSEASQGIAVFSSIKAYNKNGQIIPCRGNFSNNFNRYQLHFFAQLIQSDSIDNIQAVIERRFGKQSPYSQFFSKALCNTPKDIQTFKKWFETHVGQDSLVFYKENFRWNGDQFEILNRIAID